MAKEHVVELYLSSHLRVVLYQGGCIKIPIRNKNKFIKLFFFWRTQNERKRRKLSMGWRRLPENLLTKEKMEDKTKLTKNDEVA